MHRNLTIKPRLTMCADHSTSFEGEIKTSSRTSNTSELLLLISEPEALIHMAGDN